jgi:hypothetical protein
VHLVRVVDDERAALLDAAAVAHLALAGTEPLGLVDLGPMLKFFKYFRRKNWHFWTLITAI